MIYGASGYTSRLMLANRRSARLAALGGRNPTALRPRQSGSGLGGLRPGGPGLQKPSDWWW